MGEDFLSGNFADDIEPDYSDPLQRLELIEKLESYADAELIYTRQLTARGVVRALQFVEEYSEAQRLLAIVKKIADDPDASVKADLLEHIPQIAHFCHYNSKLFEDVVEAPISEFVLPFVVMYVKESHNQVRKASQSAILYLLEQRIITQEESAEKLVPVVINSIRCQTSDDIRADAANLMCKMVPVLGSELTERLLLEPFLQLCTDAVFHVRKVCAVNIGDVCCVVGQQRTEESVLAKFYALCEDSIWGVRKACCESFAQVSSVCTPLIRRTELSQLFINLIYDQSRWVRMAAFETLGSFIATFADPAVTGLYLSGNGVLDFRPSNGYTDVNLNLHEAKRLPQTTALSQSDGKSSDKSNLDVDVARNLHDVHWDIGFPSDGNLSNTCSYYDLDLTDRDVTPIVVELIDAVVPVTVELIDDDDADDETCMSQVSCSVNSPENPSVVDADQLPEGCRDGISAGSPAECCEDDTHKLSLEMFSSEIDICDTDLSIQCGSLQLMCENDDQTDSETLSDPIVTVEHDGVQTVVVGQIDVGHSAEDIALETLSDELSSDSLEKVSADLEIMKVCDNTGLPLDIKPSDDLVELPDDGQFSNSAATQLSNSETGEQIADHVDEVNNEESKSVPVADEEPVEVLEHTSGESIVTETCHESSGTVIETSELEERTPVESVASDGQADGDLSKVDDTESVEQTCHDVTSNVEISDDEHISEPTEETLDLSESALDVDTAVEWYEPSESSRKQGTSEEENHVMERGDWFCSTRREGHSIKTDSSSFSYVNSMNPRKMAVVESADRFISEDASRLKGVNLACLENLDESTESGDDSTDEDDQSVVPRDLLNHYLGMMEPSCVQTVDSEVTRHCAYSLPAVAFTLGRQNWSSLRSLYRALCSDVQWKVRRTLASSMHELAVIVGEDITVRDLVPVFDQFLGDLDEVRVGVLRHIADFIKLLPCDVQNGYLEKLTDLLKVDNSHNWRFREELANQLCLVVEFYDPYQVRTYIRPMAFALADDKVSAVRLAAINLLCVIMKHLDPVDIRTAYIHELTSQFASSNHYIGRQMFIQLCNCIVEKCAVDGRSFTDSFLQPLLALHLDPVPNVRIALARTIAQHAVKLEQLCREYAINPEQLDGVVNTLKQDTDRDVRMLIEQAKLFTVIC